MISLMMKHPNVYVDTSAYKSSRYPRELVDYLRGPGKRKVLFGTNFPMLTASQCLEGLSNLELDQETEALFLAGNAARLFKLSH
jgi:predicted TIM-barrel fold metal-dependent hydrolase